MVVDNSGGLTRLREVLHICRVHGLTVREDPDISCCKKGWTVAAIQRRNSLGFCDTHMVSDLADALLQVAGVLVAVRNLSRPEYASTPEGHMQDIHRRVSEALACQLGALDGQAALDEANNRVVELEAQLRKAEGDRTKLRDAVLPVASAMRVMVISWSDDSGASNREYVRKYAERLSEAAGEEIV